MTVADLPHRMARVVRSAGEGSGEVMAVADLRTARLALRGLRGK
jgi:hypothetical protein